MSDTDKVRCPKCEGRCTLREVDGKTKHICTECDLEFEVMED